MIGQRAEEGKILVARGGALGDFILTLPVLAALRGHFPNRRLEILGYERPASLALAAGLADGFRALESPELAGFFARGGSRPKGAEEYFAGFGLVISYVFDPDAIFKSNVARCGAARFVAGPHRPDESQPCHATAALLRPLEILGLTGCDPRPRLNLRPAAEVAPEQRLAIHSGSGSPRKNWPEAKWAELLRRLAAETAWHFLLVGGEAEGSRCERLAAALPAERVRLAQNLPPVELARALPSCAAFMGHDSGVTHLAAALNLPGVALWGPSNAAVWRPMSDRIRLLRDDHGLDALTVPTVFEAIERIFSGVHHR